MKSYSLINGVDSEHTGLGIVEISKVLQHKTHVSLEWSDFMEYERILFCPVMYSTSVIRTTYSQGKVGQMKWTSKKKFAKIVPANQESALFCTTFSANGSSSSFILTF